MTELAALTTAGALAWFREAWQDLEAKGGRDAKIGRELFRELLDRLDFLDKVGLGYLCLDRSAATLSGGESQRIRLAAQVGSGLRGVLYVLDEPSIGPHFEDVRRLLAALQALVDQGNTVLVIEHTLQVVKCADWIIDLGPEGGAAGGRVVATGTPEEVARTRASHTGRALRPLLAKRRRPGPSGKPRPRRGRARKAVELRVRGARQHNLRRVGARFPAASLTVVTGVSGSGKTSLAFDTLFREGQRRFVESLSTYARCFLGRLDRAPVDKIEGLLPAIAIDQKSAGRNPRSTVGTSTEILDYLRLLFARLGRYLVRKRKLRRPPPWLLSCCAPPDQATAVNSG